MSNDRPETPCPNREDKTHCVHWWEEGTCCGCGDGPTPPAGELIDKKESELIDAYRRAVSEELVDHVAFQSAVDALMCRVDDLVDAHIQSVAQRARREALEALIPQLCKFCARGMPVFWVEGGDAPHPELSDSLYHEFEDGNSRGGCAAEIVHRSLITPEETP